MAAADVVGKVDDHELECKNMGGDKLTYEIFSILENNFLFGYDNPKSSLSNTTNITSSPLLNLTNHLPRTGFVRILSIDAGGSTDGVLAAKSLSLLEATLRRKSGNPNARVADFFDVVAGAGVGGILAGLLFTGGKDGRPIFTADKALEFVLDNAVKFSRPARSGILGRVCRPAKAGRLLHKVFGDLTLKDTLKAVLIPCYDLSSGAPFLFSRADALEMDGCCDFRMGDVCGATIASRAVELRSTNGRKKMRAVGGGVAMSNPTAAAITHVLNNKQEFPFCKGVEDLVVVSLGNGEMDCAGRDQNSSPAAYVRIAGDGAADMVDQAVGMAFGKWRTSKYVRIQGNGIVGNIYNNDDERIRMRAPPAHTRGGGGGGDQQKKMLEMIADEMLRQKNVESVLFQGKKLVEITNLEKLESFGGELIKEQDWRKSSACVLPPVIFKHSSSSASASAAPTATATATTTTSPSYSSPPRSSSATTLSTLSSSN